MKYVSHVKLALVAFGANLPSSAGFPEITLRKALLHLAELDRVTLLSLSRFWSTPAFPAGSGPDYINGAARISTTLSPEALLAKLHTIEAAFGRVRDGGRWQSRGIDLDLLAYEDQILPDMQTHDAWRNLSPERQQRDAPQALILPHPRMQDRGFVLAPLAEIAPDWTHPRLGLTTKQMLAQIPPADLAQMQPVSA